MSQKFRLHVEAVTGAGKSTLLKTLKEREAGKIVVIEEPVELWKNLDGTNFLELRSKNPRKWAFEFQTLVLSTSWKSETKSYQQLPIFERSLRSRIKVFAQYHLNNNAISSEQFSILNLMYNAFTEDSSTKPVFIYLKVSPEEAAARCKARGRPEEDSLPFDHFVQLCNLMDSWMEQEESPVLVIDAMQPIEKVAAEAQRFLKLFV